ncbi:MAG: sulfite exporter TauE/SafE family protein [Alphaproteobacteria bacterium]|nr:sulfite exporter TauE/SafE family protein [Alphaproteobacteria bacterium]
MQVYLPIAEISASVFDLIALGGITGILAGLFGIGGGFLLTPILMFMGVAPAVAVATSANQIIASSFSGYLNHLKHKRVDVLMGNHLVVGGIIGAVLGIVLFKALSRAGQIDLIITLLYVTILILIGILMAREAWLYHQGRKRESVEDTILFPILEKLPLRRHFARSEVTHSVLLPVGMGILTGLLVALMGIGGGFIMLPMMLYVLRMPPSVVVGTSLYHMTFTTAVTTLLHAVTTQTVDVVLAILLLMGSVVGAQWGARLTHRLPVHYLRALLALILFAVALRLGYGLFITPPEIFTLTVIER